MVYILTVSATQTVWERALSSVAASVAMAFRAGGGKVAAMLSILLQIRKYMDKQKMYQRAQSEMSESL